MKSAIVRRIMAVFGWILYCLGWIRIFQITPRREPLVFVLFLTSAAVILFVIVHSWIAHNKRKAAHGQRGRVTRYTPPSYSYDYLGRTLIFDAKLGSAKEVLIAVAEGNKMYSPATDAEIAQAKAGVVVGVKA